jgi:hypothetical protein
MTEAPNAAVIIAAAKIAQRCAFQLRWRTPQSVLNHQCNGLCSRLPAAHIPIQRIPKQPLASGRLRLISPHPEKPEYDRAALPFQAFAHRRSDACHPLGSSSHRCRVAAILRQLLPGHAHPCKNGEPLGRLRKLPSTEQFITGKRRRSTLAIGPLGRLLKLPNVICEMVVKVCECGINLFWPQVGMLPQQLLGRPSIVIVLACQVQHFITRLSDARDSCII